MGCGGSKDSTEEEHNEPAAESPPKKEKEKEKEKEDDDKPKKMKEKKAEGGGYSWDKQRAALNPEDFIVKKRNGEVVVKAPGTVNGQQFIIEDCENCDIYILDYSASVTVDNCINCRIFVGPVESSIFVRTCKGCKCIIACQQFRTRDCEDLDVFLYNKTQPIIEASTNMRFGCFQFNYPQLAEQFANAKLNPLVNNWSGIYDFTPGENHWGFVAKDATPATFFKALSEPGVLPEGTTCQTSLVPLTWGNRSKPSSQSCLVVFFNAHRSKVAEFCNSIVSFEEGKFIATQIVDKVIAPELLGNSVNKSNFKDPAVAIEMNGEGVMEAVPKFAATFASKHNVPLADIMYFSPSAEIANEQLGKVFDQVNIEI